MADRQNYVYEIMYPCGITSISISLSLRSFGKRVVHNAMTFVPTSIRNYNGSYIFERKQAETVYAVRNDILEFATHHMKVNDQRND